MKTSECLRSLKRTVVQISAVLAALPALAQAGIVELDERDFRDLSAGTAMAVEDFEAYPAGPMTAPILLSNGLVYSSAAPWFTGSPGFVSLTGESPISAPRTFMVVEPGVNLMAMNLFVQDADEYQVEVVTVGGDRLTISARRGDKFESFFGVRITDDSLQSVTFTALGGSSGPGDSGAGIGNYAFHAVAVGTLADAPPDQDSGKGRNRGRDR
ncbi:MAG: hypothetical protein KDH17_20545 [Rhodocyclaceae bacterium]|nr:hypothetical protein [Rhodocyclaceae bacterium]